MGRLILLIFWGLPLALIAQNEADIDSLNRIISGNFHDTIKVDVFLTLAGKYVNHSPVKAIVYCKEAHALSEKINYENGLSNSLGWLAFIHEQQGEIPKALYYNYEALELIKKTGNKIGQAILLNNLAAIYKDQGNLEKSLDLNLQSLKLQKETGNTQGIANSYNNLGLLFQGQGKIEEAFANFSKALTIYETLHDEEGIATAVQNIGALYKEQKEYDAALNYTRKALAISLKNNDKYGAGYMLNSLGGIFEELENSDSALFYYQKALDLRIEIDDKQGQAYSLKNKGNIYEKLNKIEDAKAAYEKSLILFENLGEKWGETKTCYNYGSLLVTENNLPAAETYLTRSLQLARQLGYPADIRNAADGLQKLYRAKKNWKQAVEMYDLFVQMHDSVENDNNRRIAIKTQFRYEYEKKEATLKNEQEKKDALAKAEITRQKFYSYGFAGGFAVVLLFAFVFFTQRNKIKEGKKRSDELLLNILPEEVAEELKMKGSADAKLIEEVTVIFSDFKDFTVLSEKLSPHALVKDLNECFSAFDLMMEKYGLEKIKTTGDSYMAAGGLPTPNSTHATDAIKVALEMRNFIAKGKEKKVAAGLPYFEIRIGVHTGPVVAGIVGVKKFQYDIWGDTVNTAARMEQNSVAGKINISGTTYELVKDKFKCSYRGKIEAKNKGEIDMYFIED
ncbi:MAG: tetratricopeptide repeat protein [Sphingobacteriales bacterium]|nr:MAG: tetratricopeptide repeat protein [Sphingobacteriales bacterium]